MRLGQLARKLAIRPSQIVDYLSTHQIYLEEGSNAKLNDEHVDRIVQHFAQIGRASCRERVLCVV